MNETKEKSPPGFMSYFDDLDSFMPWLSDSQRGELYTALYNYAKSKQEYTGGDQAIQMAFSAMTHKIDRDKDKYFKQCDQNSKNAKKRAANSQNNTMPTQALASDGKPSQALASDGKPSQALASDGKPSQALASDGKPSQALAANNKSNNNCNCKHKIKNDNESDGFNEFWQAYPRKENKQAALKAYAKTNPNEELLSTMLKAIERQKQSSQWQDGKFIPYPATWINNRRWEDETVIATQQSKAVQSQRYEQRDYTQKAKTPLPDWLIAGMKEMENVDI